MKVSHVIKEPGVYSVTATSSHAQSLHITKNRVGVLHADGPFVVVRGVLTCGHLDILEVEGEDVILTVDRFTA